MSYLSVVAMSSSSSLKDRVTACAATQAGIVDPVAWAASNWWAVISQPGWGDAWQYALDNATVNVNPDTGFRDDVINDAMILSAVQAVHPPA